MHELHRIKNVIIKLKSPISSFDLTSVRRRPPDLLLCTNTITKALQTEFHLFLTINISGTSSNIATNSAAQR